MRSQSLIPKQSHECQIIAQMTCDEKVPSHMFSTCAAHTLYEARVIQEMPGPECHPFHRMDGKSCHSIYDLCRKSTGCASYHRLSFPHSLSHGETESFLDRFLKDDGGISLEVIDFNIGFGS